MLLAAVTGVARTVPLGAGYRIADLLSEGHRILFPDRRGVVEGNLRVLGGPGVEIPPLVTEVFRNYGRFLFEFLRGPELSEVEHGFEGWDRLEAALSRGRGLILTVLHTGNWEISGTRLARAGVKLHAVAGTQLTRGWTAELRRRQTAAGIRILPPTVASWRKIPRLLAHNEALALLVDGNVWRKGWPVTLCGRRATFPAGPARLAARTGAALLPACCLRGRDGALISRFLEEVRLAGESPAQLHDATQRLADRFEPILREYPGQWLVFRRFFDDGPGREGPGGDGR